MNEILQPKVDLGQLLTPTDLIDGFEDHIQHGVLGVESNNKDDKFRNNFFTDKRYFSIREMTDKFWEYSNSFPISLQNPIMSDTDSSKTYKPDFFYLCLDLPNNSKRKFYYQIVCAQHNDLETPRSTVDTELQKYLDVTQDKLYGGKANSKNMV